MAVNWALGTGGNSALSMFQYGVQLGQHARQQHENREVRSALGTLASDPGNIEARSRVYSHDPRLAMQIEEDARQREFRSALSDYVGTGHTGEPQRNALAPFAQPTHPPQRDDNAAGPITRPATDMSAPPTEPAAPDMSFLGEPQSQEDTAFLRMLRTDPERAVKIQSAMRDNFMDKIQAESDFYRIAVDTLGRVTDEAGWQAGLQRLAPMVDAIGGDLSTIPANYPGPEAVQALMERALPIKERLDYLLRQANYEADNARADRNAESLISTREARLTEYERTNRAREANQRRGQDMTDARTRSLAANRGQGSASGSTGGSNRPMTATGANGEKYELRGNEWVQVN